MNKQFFTILYSLTFIFYSCGTTQNNDETLAITKQIIKNSKRFDNTFIILKQKQGLFDYAKVNQDTIEFLFNTIAFSYNDFNSLSLKFNLDSIKNANFDYDFGIITSQWNHRVIEGMRVVPLVENLTYQIDSTSIYDWKLFKGFKTKKICLFSDPIFSIDGSHAIIGIQIFTDSLYYLNVIELQKNKVWEISLDIATKQRLVDVKLVNIAPNEFNLKPSKTIVISGWKKLL